VNTGFSCQLQKGFFSYKFTICKTGIGVHHTKTLGLCPLARAHCSQSLEQDQTFHSLCSSNCTKIQSSTASLKVIISRLAEGFKWQRACLATSRPRVQTPVPPKKKNCRNNFLCHITKTMLTVPRENPMMSDHWSLTTTSSENSSPTVLSTVFSWLILTECWLDAWEVPSTLTH
jgi:hypothetical protein